MEQIPQNKETQEDVAIPESVEQVSQMELNYPDEEEYKNKAISGGSSKEVSEDAFIRTVRTMKEWLKEGELRSINARTLYSTLINILDRESMADHENKDLFKQAIKDIADADGYELRVRAGYFEDEENKEEEE